MEPFYGDCQDGETLRMAGLLSIIMSGLIALLNCWRSSAAVKAQTLFTAIQMIAVAFVVVLGIWQVMIGNTRNYKTLFDKTSDFRSSDIGSFALAMYSALWTYGGWDVVCKATEEFQNLEKDLYLGLITGVPFTIICFLRLNAAIMAVLNKQQIISSPAVITTFVRELFGTKAAYFMPIVVAVVSFGSVNALMFCYPWVLVAAAREGHMPEIFSTIHKERRTPVPAILITMLISMLLLVPEASTLITLTNYFSIAVWILRGISIFALVVLRMRQPDLPRTFKISIVIPIFVTVIVTAMILLPFVNKPLECFIALATIVSGLPVYYAFVYKKLSHPNWFVQFRRNLNYQLMRLLNTIPVDNNAD